MMRPGHLKLQLELKTGSAAAVLLRTNSAQILRNCCARHGSALAAAIMSGSLLPLGLPGRYRAEIGFVLPKTLVKARSRGEEADGGEGDLLAALGPSIPVIKEM